MTKTIPGKKSDLFLKVVIRLAIGITAIVLTIFVPAGTIAFWNGWLFCGTIMLPMAVFFFYAFRKAPDLLERRTRTKEKERQQKKIVSFSLFVFIAAFVIPGLDFRFGWSHIPLWLVIASTVFMFAGYIIILVTMLQNRFASRIIEVEKEQRVIDTGLYSVIRHPMYSGSLIFYTFTPLVLGSLYALIPVIGILITFLFRIVNEEEVLKKNLPGYEEYTKKIKYRLIPHIW